MDILDIVLRDRKDGEPMPSLLIRDMKEDTKRELAVRAAQHGRSQQAEVLAILESALHPNESTWFEALHQSAQAVGGIDLPTTKRHAPRITGALL